MFRKLKKFFAILTIVVLFPYIITVFANGKSVNSGEEIDKKDALLKEHCI